jgi:hypothetical protein
LFDVSFTWHYSLQIFYLDYIKFFLLVRTQYLFFNNLE